MFAKHSKKLLHILAGTYVIIFLIFLAVILFLKSEVTVGLVVISCLIMLVLLAFIYVIYHQQQKHDNQQKIDLIKNSFVKVFSHEFLNENILNKKSIGAILDEIAQYCIKMQKENEIFQQIYKGVLSAMINGLIIHKGMKITEVNDSMSAMTGFTKEELTGMTIDKVFIPHESLRIDEPLEDFDKFIYRSTCFSKDNKKFPVEIKMTYLNTVAGPIYLSILRDLREKREIEDQLQSERARRTQAMFDGQEMERRRLAKEIHDGLGQSLIAIRLLIEGKIAGSSEVNKEALEKIRNLIDRTIADAKLMSNNLMPSVLHEFGFVTALRQLCDHVRQSTQIKVNFDVDCSRFMLSTIQTVYLFRIAQEAINNILKHAHATEMSVIVKQSDKELFLTISDNGKGFEETRTVQNTGNGLYNMRERVNLLKGTFDLRTMPGKGTELHIVLPNWRLVANE